MIKVKVISDTICPWCYIGKRNFDLALKQVPDIKVSFEYSTFQLDPNMPPEGIDRSDYLSKKFDKEQYINIKNNIKNEAIKSGISNINNTIGIIPNTFNSHRLIYWSKENNSQLETVEEIFKSYFEESKDIGDINILIDIAEKVGLDPQKIRKKFNNDEDRTTLIDQEQTNRQNGVMGVPAYIIDDGITLTGSQPVISIVKLLEHLNKS
ncbi:DsbA family oxidoreductase [Hyphomicrobiales bacterium]|nr:DsbA family oxidoreductase [Hyphomicrobiales bacterium]